MHPRNVNILLVEDNPGDARLITEMLRETEFAGSNLVTTRSLRETLAEPMEPSSVAMVLLDLNLPDSNGIHTLEEVMTPYTASAIIVLTGLDDELLALDALRHGAQNYLTKGHIGAEQLERELRYASERHGFVMRLREADSELVARERRFRSLVEHSWDLTLMLDPLGRITYASPAVHHTFGHTPLGMAFLDLLRPADPMQAETSFRKAVQHPERAVPFTVKSNIQDSASRTLEGTITNLEHFEGVSAIVVNLHDVTARVQAMEEVVSERNDKKALIDSTKDLIWSVDADFNLITANQWFLRQVEQPSGRDGEEGRSQVPSLRFGDLGTEAWKEHYARALKGASFTFEARSDQPKPMWGEFTFNPIMDGDRITGVACSCHDITGLKEIEQHIQALNAGLEHRVVERTRQLMAANQELEQEIVKNHELANKLAARNHDLMDSINYARHIQDALFPAANDIPFFSASACMSMPRDVVSGDFVWHYETATHLLLAVADCTGHGVPGALMSMLGHSLLNQLVVERHLVAPADILTAMDEAVSALFTKYTTDEHVNDGLDMGLISVEKGTRQLHFSGALIACDLIRDGALRHLPGGRSPLGGYRWPKSKEFLDVQVPLLPGDRLVMHTDGYQSQFGGPNDRKLNGRGLRELLVRSAPMPPVAATEFLSAEFNAWKGDTEQVDDVLVMVLDV